MSVEKVAESDKFIQWYRSAWNDKDSRNFFDMWELSYKYWEGNSVNLPENDTNPGSNVNIVHPNIEGQVALLVEQNIDVEVLPTEPGDELFSEYVQNILKWIIEKNKMERKLDCFWRRTEIFGTCGFRVIFNPSYKGKLGLPEIEVVNPAYIFVDPNITDINKLDDAEFIIETVKRSIYNARNKFGDIADAIEPGFNPTSVDDYIFDEDEAETDETSKANYLHMFVWFKEKGKLQLVEMAGCGVILSDSREKGSERYFPNDKYPYKLMTLYRREGTIWGKGDAELLINLQDLINDIDDQIRINARLSGNPQKLISTSAGIDIEKWTNEPGLNIPCHEVGTAYQPVIPPPMAQYPIERRRYALEYETAKVTRFSDQQTGVRQQGVDTATEALALQQAGSAGIGHKKLLLQETLSEVFEYILDCVKEYYTEEQAFRITGKKAEFMFFKGSKLKSTPKMIPATDEYVSKFMQKNPALTPPTTMIDDTAEAKESEFDVKVTVGAGLPTNKAFVYQVINEAFAKGIITPQEARNLLREYVKLPVPETPIEQQQLMPQQGQQGQPVQNPNMMGMTQGGNPMQPSMGGAMG